MSTVSPFRRRLLSSIKPKAPNYLCFTALEEGTFTLTIPAGLTTTNLSYVEYSIDGGSTWTKTNNVASTEVVITTPTISAGGKVFWRGSGQCYGNSTSAYSMFSSTGLFDASGNLMSLVNPNDFKSIVTHNYNHCFYRLFYNSLIVNAENLIMPVTTMRLYYYADMFRGCAELLTPPQMPSEQVVFANGANNAYGNMFRDCSKLIIAPNVNVDSTRNTGLESMFYNCYSLLYAPLVKVGIIGTNGIRFMFYNCSSLRQIPAIIAELDTNWASMFYNCSSATSFEDSKIFKRLISNGFYGCSSLPEFVDFRNVENIEADCIRGSSVRYLFLPKLVGMSANYIFRGTTLTLLDAGKSCTILGGNSFLSNGGSLGTLILRSITPPTLGGWSNNPGKIYVPSESLSTYQNTAPYSNVSNIYAIGGAEWKAQFSAASNPASEYADVDLYVPSDLKQDYIDLYNA